MPRPMPPAFWIRDTLLTTAAAVLAPAIAMVTLVYWALVGWPPLLALFGVLVGRAMHRRSGLAQGRMQWQVLTPLALLAGTAVGAALALALAQSPGEWGLELLLVPIGGLAAVLALHAWLLRRAA